MSQSRAEGFGPEVKRRIMIGTYVLSHGYYDAYYLQAQRVRTLIAQDFARAFEQVDVLVSPTTPTTAFKLGEKVEDPMAMYNFDLFTLPLNLAGLPGMSVPAGKASDTGFQKYRNVAIAVASAMRVKAQFRKWNQPAAYAPFSPMNSRL